MLKQGKVLCETPCAAKGEKRLPGRDSPELRMVSVISWVNFEAGNRWELFPVEHVKLLFGEPNYPREAGNRLSERGTSGN